MQEASLQGILRIVLIIFLVYFGLKILIRWFGPMLLRYVLKKLGNKFQDQYRQASGFEKQKDETILKSKRPKERKSKEKVGEYIDFEEID